MTGYIQWPALREFKPQDVVLNGGLFWRLDGAGKWRIVDKTELLPGQAKQPKVEGGTRC